jgi:cytochrome P450
LPVAVLSQPTIQDELSELFAGGYAAVPDPYPLYERLREEAPIYLYDETTAIVSRHREAKQVYREHARFPNPAERFTQFGDAKLRLLSPEDVETYRRVVRFEDAYLSRLNGPRHQRVRSAGQRAFTPKRLRDLRDGVVRRVETRLDLMSGLETYDFVDFAYRLPLLVIIDMFGAPEEDADRLREWGDAINAPSGQMPLLPETVHEAYESALAYRAYVRELVERGRATDDQTTLVAALLDASAGDALTEEELVAMYVLLLFAGHETTANLLTNGLRALLEHRDQWELLCDDASLAPAATDELLRYDAPTQLFRKYTLRDEELAGVTIPANTFVMCANAAANRDPRAFDDPDDLDLRRRPNDHLSLGYGVHYCLGAGMARMEGEIAFAALARRFPEIELAVEPSQLAYRPHSTLRGLLSMPVRPGRDRG